jgi:hypothetical protein
MIIEFSDENFEKFLSVFDVHFEIGVDIMEESAKKGKISDSQWIEFQSNLQNFFSQLYITNDVLKVYAINENQEGRAKELEEIGDLSSEISTRIGQLSLEQFKVFRSLYIPGETTDIFGTIESAGNKMFS